MMMNIDVKIRNPYNNCILRKIIYHQYLPMLIGISDQMGAQTDRLRFEVCQNLILSPMNTGPLRPAVATAPTVYGIETLKWNRWVYYIYSLLQQHLPFTVLKPCLVSFVILLRKSCNSTYRSRYAPKGARQQRNKATMRSAHLKYLNAEKAKRG